MANRNIPEPPRPANLTADQMRSGITKLERRIADLRALKVDEVTDGEDEPEVRALQVSIKQTLQSVFGSGSEEYRLYDSACHLDHTTYHSDLLGRGGGTTVQEIRQGVSAGVKSALGLLEQAVRSLKEELDDLGETASGRALRAYEGLDLHPEIERAASKLYRDGHYPNAIQDAVKALNGLVRLRSGREDLDGTTLMETVFSPKNPILKFNALANQSDIDEQKGFMMMFSGAVAGLRNPRAHEFIKDDPERTLEFIAYVSLLAKLLDTAQK